MGGHIINKKCIRCGIGLENNIFPCALKKYWYLCKKCYVQKDKKSNWYKNRGRANGYAKHRDKILQYRHSIKGKASRHKADAKRRNLEWIKLFENPFFTDTEIDWHHITNIYVVAVPREMHRLYLGKHHREKLMNIVTQIYLNNGNYFHE